jgi:hypothetical protein
VPPVVVEPDAGETVTELTDGLGGAGPGVGAVTVTTAEAVLVGSALLIAVTVSVPAFAGAVYTPAVVMLPDKAFQVTVLLDVVP